MIREAIRKLVERQDLTSTEASEVMAEIMGGKASEAQIAAFLTALRMKGETVEEVAAFARIMRSFSVRITPRVQGRVVDIVGTGGDACKTFNVSTTAAFVAAGAGAYVAKHGNRSVTGRCGSADVMERLGFNLGAEPSAVEKAVEEIGIGYLFAPRFHPAMKFAAGPRKEVGIRTVFNILGPLTNPAGAQAQLVGVYDQKLTDPIAQVLKHLGLEEAIVVYGLEGVDEISITNATVGAWLRNGSVKTVRLNPEDFEVKPARPEEVSDLELDEAALCFVQILSGDSGERHRKRLEMVLVNSAVALVVAGKASDFREGMELARHSIKSREAYRKLKELVRFSGGDLGKMEGLEKRLAGLS